MATRRGGSSILLFMRYDYKSLSSSLHYRNKVIMLFMYTYMHFGDPHKSAQKATDEKIYM